MNARGLFSTLKDTFFNWNEHDAPRLGAALAFYTILSLSPLMILCWCSLVLSLLSRLPKRKSPDAGSTAEP
jgi:uncharacterized BrkB/YihY/UPF0761 family membrane protein